MRIESLLTEYGWVYSDDGEIEEFSVNGEMALIKWFRQTRIDGSVHEYNSRYVIKIVYKEESNVNSN